MNYLFVGGFDLPNRNAAAQRIMAIADMLAMNGHLVDIIGIASDPRAERSFVEHSHGIRIASSQYPETPLHWLKYLTSIKRIKTISHLSTYDVVLCYNFPAVAFINLRINKLYYKYTLIADITEWYRSDFGGPAFRIMKYIDVTIRMYLAPVLADRLIVASQFLQSFYRNSHVLVLPTLVPRHKFLRTYSEASSTQDGLTFIYAGFPFYKADDAATILKDRIDHVVESFSKLEGSHWTLNIFGITEADYCKYLKKPANRLFGDRIRFHGKVDRAIILEQYLNSSYSVFFRDQSRSNLAGFPTKLSESFDMGVPVITNDVGDSKEYVGRDRGFVFPSLEQEYHLHLRDVIIRGAVHARRLRRNILAHNPLNATYWIDKVNRFMTLEE